MKPWVWFAMVVLFGACVPQVHDEPPAQDLPESDGGRDAQVDAGAGTTRTEESEHAEKIADALEAGYNGWVRCRDLEPRYVEDWDGYDRDCTVALLARHLSPSDALGTCFVSVAGMLEGCAEARCAACPTLPLLDDNPLSELSREVCRVDLTVEMRQELRTCERLH